MVESFFVFLLAVSVLLIAFSNLELYMLGFLLVLPFIHHIVIFEAGFANFYASYLLAVVFFFSYGLKKLVQRKKIIELDSKGKKIILLWLCWAGLSTLNSQLPDTSLREFIQLVYYVFLYFIVGSVNFEETALRRFAYAWIFATTVMAILAIFNFITGQVATWSLAGMRTARASIFSMGPNILGLYLLTGFFIGTVIAIHQRRSFLGQLTLWVCVVTIFFSILVTYSRGTLLSISGVILCYLLITPGSKKVKVAVSMVTIFGGLFLMGIGPVQYLMGTSIFRLHDSVIGRLYFAKVAAEMMADYPLFGIGTGIYKNMLPYYSYTFFPEYLEYAITGYRHTQTVAHNVFLQFGAEMGLPGLGLFLVFVFWQGKTTVKVLRGKNKTGTFSLTLAFQAAFFAILFQNLSITSLTESFWLLSAFSEQAFRLHDHNDRMLCVNRV